MAISPSETSGVRRRDLRGVTVRRRQRVGVDRLDVINADGRELGWYDLRRQQVHPASPAFLPTVLSEVAAWLQRWGPDGGPAAPGPETSPRADVAATPAVPLPDGPPAPTLPPPDPRSRVSVRRVASAPEPYATAPGPGVHLPPVPLPARQLVARAYAGDPPPPPAVPPGPPAVPAPTVTPRASVTRVSRTRVPTAAYDLVDRRPGAEAWKQAEALRAQAPVRAFLGRLNDARTDERSWRLGAQGEEAVADQLARLRGRDPRWGYLNAVPVGTRGADIDHVVMGPGGVFTINAKHHPGGKVWVGGATVMVNGKKYPYVRNSLYEADRASRLLSRACGFPVLVTPVIVLVGHADLTIRTAPEGVLVLPRRQVATYLRRRPDLLPPAELRVILDRARISTTWSRR